MHLSRSNRLKFSKLNVRKKILTLLKKLYNIFVAYLGGKSWYLIFFFIFVKGSSISLAYKQNSCKNFSHFELEWAACFKNEIQKL